MNKRRITLLVCTLLLAAALNNSFSQSVSSASRPGSFEGSVITEWLVHDGPDRKMRVVQAFTFQDSNGREWSVEEGATTDGASIPRAFWSLFGSPFLGDYRRAAVVHDYYCEVKTRHSVDVHRMFYEATLADGVSRHAAKVMYGVLQAMGLRWEWIEYTGADGGVEKRPVEVSPPTISEEQLKDIVEWIESEERTLDEIDAYLGKYE